MTPDHKIATLIQRADEMQGQLLALQVAAQSLFAAHPDKQQLRIAFQHQHERIDANLPYQHVGDEVHATYQDCCSLFAKLLDLPDRLSPM